MVGVFQLQHLSEKNLSTQTQGHYGTALPLQH